MDFEEYLKIDALNWSKLKHIAASPLEMQHKLYASPTESADMRIGRAIHTRVLEPHEFTARHPEYLGKTRSGKVWDEFESEHKGADILNTSEMNRAVGAAEAVLRHPVAGRYFEGGVQERVVVWTDKHTGIKCKARLDQSSDRVVELKSVNKKDFAPHMFGSHVARMMYHGQIVYYQSGVNAAQGTIRTIAAPVIVAVQNEAPFDVAVYECDDDFMEAGEALVDRLLQRYLECFRGDDWPGVCTDGPMKLHLPAWARMDEEDDQPLTIGGVALEF